MNHKMFCFQCEQTAGCTGCTKSGVCGKTPDVANLQDKLTGALIRLAEKNQLTKENDRLIIKSLFTTITNVNFNVETLMNLLAEVHAASGNALYFQSQYRLPRALKPSQRKRSAAHRYIYGHK